MKIAIDGLSATGKTACSKLLAKKLNYKVFNTGNLYRMVGLQLINNNVDIWFDLSLRPLKYLINELDNITDNYIIQ